MLRDRRPDPGLLPERSDLVLVDDGVRQDIRWWAGERLEHLFEAGCDRMRDDGRADHLAVDGVQESLTYAELDARANQLARHLLGLGVGPGERVALLLDDAVQGYVGMLAALKAGAAYVPLDAGFPADRLAYIVADARVGVVLALEHLRPRLGEIGAAVVYVDSAAEEIRAQDPGRLRDEERGEPVDDLAYVIYTSGSTGRPKGVAVEHSSICNFVRVAAEMYGYRPDDRVYQGLTIAFDFSVEEIWVPWAVGATLVPKPAGSSLLGADLHEFLVQQRVSAMCCVPTLLATIDDELPDLRFLLVSGEACPHDLIVRWHRPGRRFLNVYGPTEATVTATWTLVDPDRAVTIGVPLPTYSTVILDPADPGRALPPGEVGEIGIAGVGLAVGYVNRDDLTAAAFVPDFLGIPGNPSGRIYRTGDLGRVNADGEIEYLGRIDLQVKIRGYRIELTEIESVLLETPGVAQAVVDTYEPVPGTVELVGYYSLRHDAGRVDPAEIHAVLRGRLPAYMVPAYLECLDVIPMTASDKADRKNLPAPSTRLALGAREYVAPSSRAENLLATALAETLGVDRVSVDSHFFDDLGANSLLLAQFCGRVRKQADLPPVSIRDVYLRPTIAALATGLPAAAPVGVAGPDRSVAVLAQRVSTPGYLLCGALQLLAFLASLYAGAVVLEGGFAWVAQATDWQSAYLRSVAYGAALFGGFCALPIVAKWLLIGRWKPAVFPVWSMRYLRFWLVKLIIRANPMALFAGSPLYVLYLRALGAKIGPGVTVFTKSVPVCADLLTIGAGTVIRASASLPGYRAQAGMIQIGPVTLGENVLVGEKTVLEIGTSMGDGAQLGHCSSLHPGHHVPAGERWHGSPAEPTEVDYRVIEPARCGTARRFWYGFLQVFNVLVFAPLALAVVVELTSVIPWTADLLDVGHHNLAGWVFYAEVLVISLALFFGGALVGLVLVGTVPRLLHRLVSPGTVHALYGYHYWVHRLIRRLTNVGFFHNLFGDSSYIVGYLKYLGYDLSRVQQTGSNFGTELGHDSPYLTTVGTGTMVSDALTIMNADYSSTSFRVAPVALGEHNYLGNNLAYPVDAKIGSNCLLATKAMIPIDGPVRHDVGLLGSPCFEIPRSVQRDSDHQKTPEELARGLAAKNRHNRRTMGVFLAVQWFQFFLLMLITTAAGDLYHLLGTWSVVAALLLLLVVGVGYSTLVERLTTRFRDLKPQLCSIYDPYFWWHERHWKLLGGALFAGTPFKPLMWRLLGVKIGRRVFDNGCSIPEKTLVTIGDEATLNEGAVIQCHSLEDGVFKSDRTVIGAGSTLGIQSFVHYGVTMGTNSVLDADAFLMKGEEVAPGTRWRGNPARETREPALRTVIPAPPVVRRDPVPIMRLVPIGMAVVVSVALSLSIAVSMALAASPGGVGQPTAAWRQPAPPDPVVPTPAQPVPAAPPAAEAAPPAEGPDTGSDRERPAATGRAGSDGTVSDGTVPDGAVTDRGVTDEVGVGQGAGSRTGAPAAGSPEAGSSPVPGPPRRSSTSAPVPTPTAPRVGASPAPPAPRAPVAPPPAPTGPITEGTPDAPAPVPPPASRPPAGQPPSSQPPVSRPPSSQPPVSRPPSSQPPVSRPPTTRPPSGQPTTTRPSRPPSSPSSSAADPGPRRPTVAPSAATTSPAPASTRGSADLAEAP